MTNHLAMSLVILLTLCGSMPSQERSSIGPAELYWLMTRACFSGDELSVSMLLRAGADPSGANDYPAFLEKYKIGYEPTLHLITAARKGHLLVVRQLLEAGAPPNLREGEGNTALSVAAARGHRLVVVLLLRFGADKAHRTPFGTAADLAEEAGHKEIVDLLRETLHVEPDNGHTIPLVIPQTIPPPKQE